MQEGAMTFIQLELVITDFCNLNCQLCAQGVSAQKNKKNMSIDYLKDISVFLNHMNLKV